jgi:flagellar biosynthesis protein FlhG
LDADLGLGNMDVLLGIAPKFNISPVIRGEKSSSIS